MLLFSEKRPTIMIENPHDQILSLPIIIEDGESETESDFEDFQPIIIVIPTSAPPVRERDEIEIEIIYEPANIQYIEASGSNNEQASDSNGSGPDGVEKMDISDDDDDNFGEISNSKHSTRYPVEFSVIDNSGSMKENETGAHTTVNADEVESSNSRYHSAYGHTL